MNVDRAAAILECLAAPTRLRAHRLVIAAGSAGMFAGEIARRLEIAPSGASFHLKAMVHAELVTVRQEGRHQRYCANPSLMLELVDFLTRECCAGHPEPCARAAIVSVPPSRARPASPAARRAK